jgi:hypothetical protein
MEIGTNISVRVVKNLPFQKVQHRVDTTDAQPSGETGGIMVMVTGALMVSSIHLRRLSSALQELQIHRNYANRTVVSKVDDQPQPMNYTQIFQLLPEAGTYFVQNDIFRLVYPASG